MRKVRESDYIGKLVGYAKKNLSKGYSTDVVRFSLLKQGHSRSEIERAIMLAKEELAKEKKVEAKREEPKPKVEIVAKKESFFSKIAKIFKRKK